MLKTVLKLLAPYKNEKLIMSVSSGVDSMVLLDFLYTHGFHIVVVHFNHQKRATSISEAEYLELYCKERLLTFEYICLNIEDSNFQEAARLLRFKHLEMVADRYNTPYIVTAHHLNDLAETILMKLSRGSNLYGYSGFQFTVKRGNYLYLKPLIQVKKSMLYDYAKTHTITFFEDSSNQENTYTRNRFRHDILDQLIKENPQFLEKSLQYSIQLYEAFSFIRENAKEYLDTHKNTILLSSFLKLNIALKKDIIALWMENHNIPFNQKKMDAILDFLNDSGPNQSYPLSQSLVMKKKYQKVYIEKPHTTKSFKQELDLEAFNVFENMGYVTFLNSSSNISDYDINICYNKMTLPLWARHRKPGDFIEFDYGHKKLKDFYIDRKIPLDQRNKDIVITDNEGRILAVLGRYYNHSSDLTETIKLRYKRGV